MYVDVRPPDGAPRFKLVASIAGGFVLRTLGVAVVIEGRCVLPHGHINSTSSVRDVVMLVNTAHVLTYQGVTDFPEGTYLVRSDRFVRVGDRDARGFDVNFDAIPDGGVFPGETVTQAILRKQ